MRRLTLSLALAFAAVCCFILYSPRHVIHACSCGVIEPDVAYQQAVMIFTGTVVKVTELASETQDGKAEPTHGFGGPARRVTRFAVEEYFKGDRAGEMELRGRETSCDIFFEAGKRYLVYATQDAQTGELGAYSCSRTRVMDEYAKPDIGYLRRVARGERPTMIYGFALKSVPGNPTDPPIGRGPERLGGLNVRIVSADKPLVNPVELKTDASGYFEAYDLPPGNYTIRTGVTGKLRGAEEKTIELRTGSVASVTFWTTAMGSVSGRLVDPEGRPVSEIQVNLLYAAITPGTRPVANYVQTAEDGKFSFNEVPAGQYLLGVNMEGRRSLYGAPFLPSYFPNAAAKEDARVITATDGATVDVGDFMLQARYPTVPISGAVVWADGRPVMQASIRLEKKEPPWDASRFVWTDASGQFAVPAYEGVTYKIHAVADAPNGMGTVDSDWIDVTAAKGAPPLRLVLKAEK